MTQAYCTEPASVIIPTYNGAQKLARAIPSLAAQTILPAELVVVVDGSTDKTISLLHSLVGDYPRLNIRIVVQPNSGRANAKNRGILEASFELLVFLDDDMEPVDIWLESHIIHHANTKDSIATGTVVAPSYSPKSDLRSYQEWLHHQWNLIPQSTEARLSFPYIHAGNFSATRSTLTSLGCFRAGLLDFEDRLLAINAFERSVPLYILQSAKCTHHDTHCNTFMGMAHRALEYERARDELIRQSPEYLRYQVTQPFRPKYPKSLVYYICSHYCFLRAADLGLFFLLPRFIRYPFYSLLITAFSRYSC